MINLPLRSLCCDAALNQNSDRAEYSAKSERGAKRGDYSFWLSDDSFPAINSRAQQAAQLQHRLTTRALAVNCIYSYASYVREPLTNCDRNDDPRHSPPIFTIG